LMDSESPPRRSEFLLDSLFMNSRPFSMERPLVEEDPFPDRRGVTECLPLCGEPRLSGVSHGHLPAGPSLRK
ncbi:MAG: hypothetical protein L3J03_06055, partial [Desulfobacterales bacterium]|nr:hypothetical protein [Desulfobacterales bacterium]